MVRRSSRSNTIGRLLEKVGRMLRGGSSTRSGRTTTATSTRSRSGGLMSTVRRLLRRFGSKR